MVEDLALSCCTIGGASSTVCVCSSTVVIVGLIHGRCHGPSLDKPPVHDSDIDGEEKQYKDVVQQTHDAKHGLWDHVERWQEVDDSEHNEEQETDTEHENQAARGEEVSETVVEQGRQIADTVHQLHKQQIKK